jgi:hypothetical protein
MSIRKIGGGPPLVIVRAWGGEPVVLRAHGVDAEKRRVLVGSDNATRPISLPQGDVFAYDEKIFDQLTAAHAAGDDDRLTVLYESAEGSNYLLH